MLWNVEGLDHIKRHMPVNIFKEDIIILTETFLTKESSIQGYHSHHSLARQGPAGRPSGGISCFYKPWLAPTQEFRISPNLLLVQLRALTVACAYYQPDHSIQYIIDDLGQAFKIIGKQHSIIVAGDFNCRMDKPTIKSNMLIDFMKEEGLTLMNNYEEPTYICHNGRSTIDLIFSSANVGKKDIKILTNTALSPFRKHQPVVASVATNRRKPEEPSQRHIIERRLNEEALRESNVKLEETRKHIAQGHLNVALKNINGIIKEAQQIGVHFRKAQKMV